jgi:hypothetical protein
MQTVLVRLSLAGNLEKPLMPLYETEGGSAAMDTEHPGYVLCIRSRIRIDPKLNQVNKVVWRIVFK